MLATLGGRGLSTSGAPEAVVALLQSSFAEFKRLYGDLEAVVIAIPDGEYNLQLRVGETMYLTERISRLSPIEDFKKVVSGVLPPRV